MVNLPSGMGRGNFVFKYYYRPFIRFAWSHVIFPHVTYLSLFTMFMSRCIRTTLACQYVLRAAMITSILSISNAHTHNSEFRAHNPWTPLNSPHHPYDHRNGIYIVTFKNYDKSPSVPNTFKHVNDLKREAVPKMLSRKKWRVKNQGYPSLETKKGSPLYDVLPIGGATQNGGTKISNDVIKSGLNLPRIPGISAVPSPDVITDSYRSQSLCLDHYQTHWIRDSANCSVFFVCSRNRVDAVLSCPKTFVWSNRVTNCVPSHSRWDDCSPKTIKNVRYGISPRKRVGYVSRKQTKLSAIVYDVNANQEKLISSASSRTVSSSPPPIIIAKASQPPKPPRQYKSPIPRRQRLGYRSSLRLKNKLFKRRKSRSHGYVVHSLNKKETAANHRWGNNNKKEERQNTQSSYSEKNLSKRGRQMGRRNRHRLKNMDRSVKQRNKIILLTTQRPAVTSTHPTTTPTTPITSTKKSVTSNNIKRRNGRKYRRITHSYNRARRKPKHLNQNSRSRHDRRFRTRSRQDRVFKHPSRNALTTTTATTTTTTTQPGVSKWWKDSQDWIQAPIVVADTFDTVPPPTPPPPTLPPPTPSPPPTTTTTTTTIVNTTYYGSQTSPSHRVFVPECGVSAAPLIVGGLPVKRDKWPWVVSLQLTWLSRHMCGATLIHPRWLVTAAHCMAEPDLGHAEDWRVIFEHVKSRAKIDYIVKHPSFINGDNYPNDIALLRLKHPADVTGFHIRHACLPPQISRRSRPHWDKCWIMGWGEAKENTVAELKELEVNIWKNSECSARWGWKRILNSHMCVGTGDSGACNGDSGGPLICRRDGYHYLAGVTSWGVYGCQTTGYPGVFINVASYRTWIDNVIRTHTTT